jgi:hypothetical protein
VVTLSHTWSINLTTCAMHLVKWRANSNLSTMHQGLIYLKLFVSTTLVFAAPFSILKKSTSHGFPDVRSSSLCINAHSTKPAIHVHSQFLICIVNDTQAWSSPKLTSPRGIILAATASHTFSQALRQVAADFAMLPIVSVNLFLCLWFSASECQCRQSLGASPTVSNVADAMPQKVRCTVLHFLNLLVVTMQSKMTDYFVHVSLWTAASRKANNSLATALPSRGRDVFMDFSIFCCTHAHPHQLA